MKPPEITLASNQSIFTSEFFTGWVDYFRMGGLPLPKFNGEQSDLLYFLKGVCLLLSQTYVGISSRIGSEDFPIDGTNLALAETAYWAMANKRTAEHYFPTEDLYQALKDTDIQWVDLETWKALPDFVSIKVPVKRDLICHIMNSVFSIDDIMITRVKQPMLRVHHADLQGVTLTDETEVWFWMTQSRDEADKLLQNSTFGSIVLDKHTKLEDLLERLVNYATRVDIELAKQVEDNNLMDVIDSNKLDLKTQYGIEHAEYVKGMFRDRDKRIGVEYKNYRDVLEFVLKFITFKSTEQFHREPIKIPGLKPNKTSAKSKEIQAKLLGRYGTRFVVGLPPAPPSPSEDPGTHKTPIKHLVRGFFRQQPYGPKKSLRKTIWVLPFWRGTDTV
jgi:hypothetical protein